MVLPLETPLLDRGVRANVKIMKRKAKDPILNVVTLVENGYLRMKSYTNINSRTHFKFRL